MTIEINEINQQFSTAPQVSAEDFAEIAKLGFKTIINNRPDYEGGDAQPASASLKAAAEAAGLAYFYIPVIPNNIQADEVAAFAQTFSVATKPVLGFCRTGNRAGKLFQLAQVSA